MHLLFLHQAERINDESSDSLCRLVYFARPLLACSPGGVDSFSRCLALVFAAAPHWYHHARSLRPASCFAIFPGASVGMEQIPQSRRMSPFRKKGRPLKLFGKSLFDRYTAPLTVPLLLACFLLPGSVAVAWASLAVPRLCSVISPMEDAHPFAHSILHTSIGFMLVPAFVVPQFLMIHFYQKHYDRKKRWHRTF